MTHPILIRGGGDLASGVALRLHRAGYRVVITELPQPLAVRRAVSFAEAVYERQWIVESVTSLRVETAAALQAALENGEIPVVVDPDMENILAWNIPLLAVVDARLLKTPQPAPALFPSTLTIGLGPGFTTGQNCHAVIETQRGHTLGRVYWHGEASQDTRQPEGDPRRVLRAPGDGLLRAHAEIGQHLEPGQWIADINGLPIASPFAGVLRGLIRPELFVTAGTKIGDVDPRNQREYCFLVSDKALAIGGGVLEAICQTLHEG